MLESDKDNDGILDFNEFKVSTKNIINIMRKAFFDKWSFKLIYMGP